jgi:PiT family inorganic phosphate transporter
MLPPLAILLAPAVRFDFLNGFHDSSNVIATVMTSEALSPCRAWILAAICHFAAPFISPRAVATILGRVAPSGSHRPNRLARNPRRQPSLQ